MEIINKRREIKLNKRLEKEKDTLGVTHPTLLERLKCKSKSGNNGRSWGMFPSSQHFGGKRACCKSKMAD
jgi:hypothetical protein